MNWLVIGISGPTCCGKTSLAKKLHESIEDSIMISQDTYFLPEGDPKHLLIPELNHYNWEILSSLNMPKMHSDIIKFMQSISNTNSDNSNRKFKTLIIEGFLIYNFKPVADLCNWKFFIDTSNEVCKNRRKHRVYKPPDVPGYFEKVVWPEYLRHKSEIICDTNLCKTIKFLDGNKGLDELYNEIKNEVSTCILTS